MSIESISKISPGIQGLLVNNVSKMNEDLGQKVKDFTFAKINSNDRRVLVKLSKEQRNLESQKIEYENQKSFSAKSHETLNLINELTVEFVDNCILDNNKTSKGLIDEYINQYIKRLEILLNTKHGDRNVFGGDGEPFDLSKAKWDDVGKILKNMDWISIPKNGFSKDINSGIIRIVESLAQFKYCRGNVETFNTEIKPKIRTANTQLITGISEDKFKMDESDAKIKLNDEKIVALQ